MSYEDHPDENAYEPRGHREDVPLSVAQLNWFIKNTLEQTLPMVWVEGEVSDLSRPSSGHIYFSLKDDQSQVRAVIWRTTANRQKFEIKDGIKVVCYGAIEVYAPRGSYQVIIDRIQPIGVGPLQLAFQQLHQKLSAQGLFAPERKQPLPPFPKRIGFITSPSGAAIQDFIEASKRQWGNFELTVIPVRVQGTEAASEIARAIRLAHRIKPAFDLLIVGRGGGSMEDLWSFNDEKVVRGISNSRLPIVSAVGHEIDVTLSDLAADARALTPTHAAQLVLPNHEDISNRVQQLEQRVHHALSSLAARSRLRLENLSQRGVLSQPHTIHQLRRQKVDEAEIQLNRLMRSTVDSQRENLASVARAIEALSPLNVLSRGYSISQRVDNSETISSVEQVAEGETIQTRLAKGAILSQVLSVSDDLDS